MRVFKKFRISFAVENTNQRVCHSIDHRYDQKFDDETGRYAPVAKAADEYAIADAIALTDQRLDSLCQIFATIP